MADASAEVAQRALEQTTALATAAREAGLEVLAYVLGMAALEAEHILVRRYYESDEIQQATGGSATSISRR